MGCWTVLTKAVGVIYSAGGVGDFLSSSSSNLALGCAFVRPAKTKMVQARTIALGNSSNLNNFMAQFLSLVKFPHDPAERRAVGPEMANLSGATALTHC